MGQVAWARSLGFGCLGKKACVLSSWPGGLGHEAWARGAGPRGLGQNALARVKGPGIEGLRQKPWELGGVGQGVKK